MDSYLISPFYLFFPLFYNSECVCGCGCVFVTFKDENKAAT